MGKVCLVFRTATTRPFSLTELAKPHMREELTTSKKIIEPADEIMVLITQATSEDSGEPAYPRSLTRAFAVRTHEVWK